MDLRLDEAPETELNMTPMIDIVFQLIIFFLLSLKFKTIDRRIESMLPDKAGLDSIPQFEDEDQKIKLKVFRRNLDSPSEAFTLIKLDNSAQYRLPAGWKGRRLESPARVKQYDAVVASIQKAIQERVAIYGGLPEAVKGEIVAPPPRGGAVPHGDVVALLDAFIAQDVLDVRFEGTANPLGRRASERRQRERAR